MTHELVRYKELNLVDALSYGFIGLKSHHSLQQSIETQAKLLGFNIRIGCAYLTLAQLPR